MASATANHNRLGMRIRTQEIVTAPEPKPSTPLGRWLPRLAVPLGSSLLLWACFFPLSFGFLAWVALVPLLSLVRHQMSGKRVFWLSYLGGFAFFLPSLYWMGVADPRMILAWILLAVYCALYFPVAMVLIRAIDRTGRAPLWLSVPLVWVGLEFIRSIMLSGFAWYYLGHSQHEFTRLIQMADLGGAYLVSFLVAAVNGWIVECLYRWPEFRRVFKQREPDAPAGWGLIAGGLLLVAAFGAAIWYGGERLGESSFRPGPRIALLQGNIDQRLRNMAMGGDDAARMEAGLIIGKHYERLYPLAYDYEEKRPHFMPDLVIWPETSFPAFWCEDDLSIDAAKIPEEYKACATSMRDVLKALTGKPHATVRTSPITGKKEFHDYFTCPTNHLLGMNGALLDADGKETQYSLAVLIDKQGRKLGRYEKIHRVPFGEFVPFQETFPFLGALSPYGAGWQGIAAGTKFTRLELPAAAPPGVKPPTWRMGVLICYEDTDPVLARQYGRDHDDGPPVDFLINISNDGWFDGTAEHEEHLAISRFRAIEARRAVVRSVNMGVSAVIDSNGRVLKPLLDNVRMTDRAGREITGKRWYVPTDNRLAELPTGEWSAFKQVHGVIHATVPIDDRTSLYSLWGDWLPALCWIAIAGFILAAVVQALSRRKMVRV
ncbi:MAG: apolipoprotein N-acyltransferase [Gemmataceae bacterium]